MGQSNSLVDELLTQDYMTTGDKNILKHKQSKQFIKISHYPCNTQVHINSYYIKRQQFSNQNNSFAHFLQLKNFIISDRPSQTIGCSNSFIPLSKSSKSQYISFASQFHQNSLDKQIANRTHFAFEEKQLWSVFCGCIMGAFQLIKAGFKEPILSPKAIFLNSQGFVKVGQWQFVNCQQDKQRQQLNMNDPLLKKTDILQNYYWAPEGPLIIQQTLCLGNSICRKISKKSQIFSLGMTLLHMCIRKRLYQVETISQAEIQRYISLAISSRENSSSPLSKEFISIIRRMLVWDYKQRASYEQLYDIAVEYFQQQNKQESFEQQLLNGKLLNSSNLCAEISQNMKKQFDSSPIVPGQGDTYEPEEQQYISKPAHILKRDQQDYNNIQFYHQLDTIPDTIKIDDTLKIQNHQIIANQLSQRHTFCQSGPISKSSFGNINNFATYHQDCFSFSNNRSPLQDVTGQRLNRKIYEQYGSQNKSNNYSSEEKLFTDPKILEMIKVKPISQQNFTKQQCNKELSQTLQLVQKKQKSDHDDMVSNFDGVIVQSCKNSHSKEYNVVKETFAKGYYQGEKFQDLRQGFGVFYYQDGGKYSGYWFDNKMHGQGTLYYPDDSIAYQGEWFQDQLHGKGILYNENPKSTPFHTYDYKSFNECQQYWKSYEGDFSHDDKSGYGILTLSNGQKFQGQFSNDMVNGRGTFYTIDGQVIRGEWKNNILVKIIKSQKN